MGLIVSKVRVLLQSTAEDEPVRLHYSANESETQRNQSPKGGKQKGAKDGKDMIPIRVIGR